MSTKQRPAVVKQFSALALSAFITFSTPTSFAAEYSPNFKGTDINEFINIVGKNLKKTIIVDPNVRGKINVRSYDLLTEEQYYQFFLNVLEVYDYAVVEMSNGVLKVIRDKDAKTSSIPVVENQEKGDGDEMVTRVVQVYNVSVKELSPLLRQLNDQAGGGNVVHYDPSNVIMLTGRASVVNRLTEIIKRVDQAGDQDVEIVKLRFASATEIVRIIETLNKNAAKDRTPDNLIPKVVADDRTNSVIVSGEGKARARTIKMIERLDSELESSGNTKVYYLKYAKAEDLVKVLQGVSTSILDDKSGGAKTTSAKSNRDISIEAHQDSNALVITAEPDVMRSLEDVIRQLDIRRAQIQVEAIIVEVFDGDGFNLGVQWISEDGGMVQFTNSTPIGSLAVGAEQARTRYGEDDITYRTDAAGQPVYDEDGNRVIASIVEGEEIQGDFSTLASLLGGVNGTLVGIVKNGWGAVLQAVTTSTNSNILATPNITTLDNQEASILVGQEVPTITGSTASSNNANPFQTVDRKEVGIKLKVTPQVNEGSAVKLEIEQEVSSVAGATGIDVSFNKREIKTTVMAENGATIVLGGLIDEDVQESVSKVPLLGDIPIIGNLFKSTSNTKRKRNLMVFIKPTIVTDDITQNTISHKKYNYIRAQQLERRANGNFLSYSEDIPVLPHWDNKLELPPSFEEYLTQKGALKQYLEADKKQRAEQNSEQSEAE
ncbi:type II secretion system secretin GspD [Catenovulum sp. 2E275]|uniref:type II secretion system secretin GspD n=1 Tax=Catenovulum sp. 2E275 TaxID=2980497 RepID=UPI0021CE6411|nr:type II secretion system secretin GspD [Catenovulum sp. 2E275]MCU4674394.1 type II secretion system secretin GspD [Catenovulum sp. 2E275]